MATRDDRYPEMFLSIYALVAIVNFCCDFYESATLPYLFYTRFALPVPAHFPTIFISCILNDFWKKSYETKSFRVSNRWIDNSSRSFIS